MSTYEDVAVQSQDHFTYRPDIDGLRAIAVMSVLVYHGFPQVLVGGFVGVDVFFVISGFLITRIILTGLQRGKFTFSQFYARRIRRIFPALGVVLAASLVMGWFVLFPVDFGRLALHTAAGAGFVSNIALWRESGYFDTASEVKPLLHLWSLGVEEQYYVVWPLLLVLAASVLHRLLAVVLVIAALSFAANILLLNDYPSAVFYLPMTRFWELMVGSILAYVHVYRPNVARALHAPRFGSALSGLGALLLVVALLVTKESMNFPGWWALLPTLGTAALIAAGPTAFVNRRLLSNKPIVYVGLISYPLYLWHWPLLTYARIVHGDIPSVAIRVAMLALSVALAALTYHLLESPIRRRVSWGNSRWVVPGLSTAVAAIACCAGLILSGRISSASASIPHVAEVSEALSDWDGGRNRTVRGDSDRAVLFFGDSHMQQYWPRIEKVLHEHRAPVRTVVFFATGGCAPIPGLERRGYQCDEFAMRGFARARQADIETVVIAASWPGLADRKDLLTADSTARPVVSILAPEEAWILQGFERELEELKASGKKIVLVLSSPRSRAFDPNNMLRRQGLISWQVQLPGPVSRSSFERLRAPIDDRLREIARRVGAETIDPANWLCSTAECPALDAKDRPLFKDLSHIRASVVREGFTSFDRLLYLSGGPQ